jgi:hypothetical protein
MVQVLSPLLLKQEKMKQKVFDVCAGLITIPQFEEWFYNDADIQCSILEDDNVLRLCSIDLKKKDAEHELKKFCFETFDQEEFYVYAIEKNAHLIVNAQNHKEVICYVQNICEYSDWGDEKALYYSFYVLWDQYDEFPYSGYLFRSDIISDMKSEAAKLLKRFEFVDLQTKKNLIFEPVKHVECTPFIDADISTKRWYQFWK